MSKTLFLYKIHNDTAFSNFSINFNLSDKSSLITQLNFNLIDNRLFVTSFCGSKRLVRCC